MSLMVSLKLRIFVDVWYIIVFYMFDFFSVEKNMK